MPITNANDTQNSECKEFPSRRLVHLVVVLCGNLKGRGSWLSLFMVDLDQPEGGGEMFSRILCIALDQDRHHCQKKCEPFIGHVDTKAIDSRPTDFITLQ
jgi:hypothetical protein